MSRIRLRKFIFKRGYRAAEVDYFPDDKTSEEMPESAADKPKPDKAVCIFAGAAVCVLYLTAAYFAGIPLWY